MGVRLYNPALGRFLQVDPVPGGSANNYDYAGQDPINAFDLNGQWWGSHLWHKVKHFVSRHWESWAWQLGGMAVSVAAFAACGIICASVAGALYGAFKYRFGHHGRRGLAGYFKNIIIGAITGMASGYGKLYTQRYIGNLGKTPKLWQWFWMKHWYRNFRDGWIRWR